MPRSEGLRPIGDSVKKIIEKIKKEREARQKKGKPVRVQPKLPGLKKGGAAEPKYTVKDEVKDRMKKETPKTGYGIGLSPLTQYRRYKHKQDIKKERARDDAKTKMKKGGDVKKPIKVKKIAIGIGKIKDYPGMKKIIEMNKKGKKRFAEGGMIPKTPAQKKFAALAEPRDKVTYADKIAGATGKSKKMKQGGMARGGGAAIRGNNFKGVY
tara:strand:+ start:374 stop:1006 length:633 start_codon:yes stop_codon:yes gene_type:complete